MTDNANAPGDHLALHTAALTSWVHAYRDGRTRGGGEVAVWRPRNLSADKAALYDAGMLRARARDLVRNNAHAKNAVRMNDDAVSGSGVKLALRIDWRSLGINDKEIASEWQDYVTRQWEAYAEGVEFQADAQRQSTFSEMFALVNRTRFIDGDALAVLELKQGTGAYQTCINLIDIDRLSNPMGAPDTKFLRGGIERDAVGEPLAYYIRLSHPDDVGVELSSLSWQRVPRQTPWGRPIVLHVFNKQRPEMTRGVSEFASVIHAFKMLGTYRDTELQSAITQAGFTAVIKTELDYGAAFQVIGLHGAKAAGGSGGPLVDGITGAMKLASDYHNANDDITFNGNKIPHLLPNESLEFNRPTHPNTNFDGFESAFLKNLAAGLGVEAHELAKNYKEVNYSAARAALLAVWRTYRARRNHLVQHWAMPFFSAWLEEGVAIGTIKLPVGVTDFLAAKPYLVRGEFIAWGKPMIDPYKERQAQQLGVQMGVETVEDIAAEEGANWRDKAEQIATEKKYFEGLGLPYPGSTPLAPPLQNEQSNSPDGV
ncbi:phage portal protein, lambda family [Hyphomicrobium denitrificans ATCC 51888]|uniref:Phage portal protein, lambda family n=1 Tax=Hyphomicrobium denitrificans (strain ATCC 51888 / DSM 1869 / NCIMB 11706 / TK 0415) TaxID=582899 RepID=D8JWB8_HYPDA|nr:phage portal protein [Hyphomicrobium denitrificans]ADJ23031.1 phage portal protein, lambda family [Hyphomicrobium denitrificans ATCC 51888]